MGSKREDREDKAKELREELNEIENDASSFNVDAFLAKSDILPELGDIVLYDYEQESDECVIKARQILDSLAKLYLGDKPKLMEHDYIKLKLEEDANIYAETIFLQKMSKKNYINQLKQIDNGENNTRMHEVVNKTASEIRANIMFQASLKTNMEDFYKKIRNDLGIGDVSESNELLNDMKTDYRNEVNDNMDSDSSGNKSSDPFIFDQRDINDIIQNALNNAASKKEEEEEEDY